MTVCMMTTSKAMQLPTGSMRDGRKQRKDSEAQAF